MHTTRARTRISAQTCETLTKTNQKATRRGTSGAIDEFLQIKESCENLNLCGVMSIGAHSDDEREIQKSFEITYKIFENLRPYGAKICSMGMSDDFELAIKCGSNMVRLGRVLYR